MMMPRPTDRNPQARNNLPASPARITTPSGPHWYVDSLFAPGYCAACNTPRENRRHVPRAA